MKRSKSSPANLKLVVGSVLCGRFDPLLRRSLSRARIDFNGICDIYGQVYGGLEEMLASLLDNDDGTMGDFVMQASREDEDVSMDVSDEDTDEAGDIFIQEVLPALAESYPDAVNVHELELHNIHLHPIVIEVSKRYTLDRKAQKELAEKIEHVVLEDIATPLIDKVLRELDVTVGDMEEVDVSLCIQQRLRDLMKLK